MWTLGAAIAYVTTGLVSNIMSLRIVTVAGWAIDAGTFAYPLAFTLRDLIHKPVDATLPGSPSWRGPARMSRWSWESGLPPPFPQTPRWATRQPRLPPMGSC